MNFSLLARLGLAFFSFGLASLSLVLVFGQESSQQIIYCSSYYRH
jgi:hypothetical protein